MKAAAYQLSAPRVPDEEEGDLPVDGHLVDGRSLSALDRIGTLTSRFGDDFRITRLKERRVVPDKSSLAPLAAASMRSAS
jgi:hypothetical protein